MTQRYYQDSLKRIEAANEKLVKRLAKHGVKMMYSRIQGFWIFPHDVQRLIDILDARGSRRT